MRLQNTFQPDLEQLTPAQKDLWLVLGQVPRDFILYGDTALSLRLSHAPAPSSFEFKTKHAFLPHDLVAAAPFLRGAEFQESGPNFLKARLATLHGVVDLTFEGKSELGEILAPERAPVNRLAVASLPDIAAVKMIDFEQHHRHRDLQDIAELVSAGSSIEEMASGAKAVAKGRFDSTKAIKKLTDFSGVRRLAVPESIQSFLSSAALEAEAKEPIVHLHSEELSDGLLIKKTPDRYLTNQRPSQKLDLARELERDWERDR
jgi:hypothetical protein